MKKILALLMVAAMLFSFAACGEEERSSGVSSGPSVDKNTIEIVNNAFSLTDKAVKEAKALGYSVNMIVSVTVDDVTTSVRASSELEYIDLDEGRRLAAETEMRLGDTGISASYFDDNENVYVQALGETYLLVGKDVDEYLKTELQEINVIDTSELTASNTVIVDAANGGHGFVIDYDVNDDNLDLNKYLSGMGDIFDTETLKDIQFTITGISISGIVDASGRLSSQTFKFTYEYTQQVEVPKTDVDPDNSDVSETTEVVGKTVKNEISIACEYDFDVTEVEAPDDITVIGSATDGDGEQPETPSEISVTDLKKLLSGNTADDDE